MMIPKYITSTNISPLLRMWRPRMCSQRWLCVAAVAPLRMPPPTAGGINEPQECPYCRRTFSCYYSLKRHFQDKHEQSDTLYVCEFCHRRYRTKNSLTTHKSLQHRGSSGMLKRLLKTSALQSALAPAPHHLFDLAGEHGAQLPPGLQ
ncbi:Broad-complex core protein isoform 6 [Eumeta japonica]|uniref:Broad-complex core protein isoform 6 n=1 Tax=Eumeta variegata TaxID=151549 RepID=A0A4C1TPW7_EUMVA|nr:Broad-complex core protein isoform 6 [Eumeta japonica]